MMSEEYLKDSNWSDYEKLVLYRLDDLSRRLARAERAIVSLQVKASLWGALGGGLTIAILIGITTLKQLIGG